MKIALIATTPYQILIAICYVIAVKEGEYDLYILNNAQQLDYLVYPLQESGLFCNVYYVEDRKQRKPTLTFRGRLYYHVFRNFAFVKYYSKYTGFQFDSKVYDIIITPFADIDFTKALRLHSGAKEIWIIEEGIGNYIPEFMLFNFERKYHLSLKVNLRRLIERIFCISVRPYIGVIYLNKPELLLCHPNERYDIKNCIIRQLPPVCVHDAAIRVLLNRCFSVNPEHTIIKERIIYLMNPPLSFWGSLVAKSDYGLDTRILEVLLKGNKNNIILKRHPHDRSSAYNQFTEFTNMPINVPFEIIYLNNDLSNKILLCIFSTSVFNAKLLFDQEPIIVFLYHLIPSLGNIDAQDNLVTRFLHLYKDSSKIHIPKTFDEFEATIARLQSKESL